MYFTMAFYINSLSPGSDQVYQVLAPEELCFFVICWTLSKTTFQKFFQEYHTSIKQIESRSIPTFYWALSGSKLFAKTISRWH